MTLEIHNLCLWEKGLPLKDRVIDILQKKENIKILSTKDFEVEKKDEIKFCKMIYYKSETNFINKSIRCGFKKFLNIEFEINCNYQFETTTRGISNIAVEVYSIKKLLRERLNCNDLIHVTDTLSESKILNFQLNNLFKKNNDINFRFDGIKSIVKLKEFLFVYSNYAVLRNPESFYKTSEHDDVDIICDDRSRIVRFLGLESLTKSRSRVMFYLKEKDWNVKLDIREPQDGYYPIKWSFDMLLNKFYNNNLKINQISLIDQYYSLVYHALLHKESISNDYPEKINDIFFKINNSSNKNLSFNHHIDNLKRFLKSNKHILSYPKDQTVGMNFANIGIFEDIDLHNDENYILPSRNCFFQDMQARYIVLDILKNEKPFFEKKGTMHASKIYLKKFGNTKLVVKFVKAVDEAASRFVYFEHEPLKLLNGAASPKIFWYGFIPKIEDYNNYEYVIIMQYLEGVTLFDMLEGNIKIELNNYNSNQVLEKIKENIINSINLIHSVGISHNDLRDKNIIITKDLTVKIIDYGLSRTSNNVDSVNLKPNILKVDSSNIEKKYNLRRDQDAIEYLISQIDNLIK